MKPYKEIQKFDQWWIKLILILVVFFTILPIVMLSKEQGIDQNMFWVVLLTVLITFAAIALFYTLRLETSIDAKGIHYRFYPFSGKTIPWKEIDECYVRQYSPLKEYGGWGIRFGPNGKAYNVKGNKGIQVKLKSGKKILFGTQNETEVKNVITSYKVHIQ